MSITITTTPAAIQAGFNDIEWGVTSDRNSRKELTVTSVTDASGFCRLNTSANPTTAPAIQVGDIVLLSGFTNTLYNVKHKVTNVKAAYVDTNVSFISDDTGTITRRNDNFKIKTKIQKKTTAWTTATGALSGSNSTFTSAIISETTVSIGDYVITRNTYLGSITWKLHKVTSVSGTTVVTSTVDDGISIGSTTDLCLTETIGSCYSTSSEIDVASVFTFELSSILNAYLGSDFIALGNTNIQSAISQNSTLVYGLAFDELFEDEAGLYATSPTGKFGSIRQLLNSANQPFDVQTLDRFILDGSTKKFLSNIPNLTPIGINQELQLSFITTATTVRLAYRIYDLSGVAAAWAYKANVTLQDADENYKRGTAIISTAAGIFNTSTSKVEVKIQDSTPADISETKTFVIDRRCYDSNVILEFRNKQGGIDSYQFSVTNESNINIEREFSRNAGVKSTSFVNSVEVKTLESRFDSKAVLEWLEDLYQSKDIYMIDSRYTGGRVKVNLVDTSYIKNSFELFSSIIEIELQEPKLN